MPDISTIEKQHFKVYYRPGSADENVLQESFENDLFLKGVPEYILKPGHIIIDIGAHIGCFTMLVASKLVRGRVYSFEPSAGTYELLNKNVTENKLLQVKTFQAAVSSRNGDATLYHDLGTGNWGHTITKAVSSESEKVKTITLESIIQSENLPHIDFIKFNCEGSEFSILLNASIITLEKIKCMLILYHGYLEPTISRRELKRHLSKAGFHLHQRHHNKDDDSGWLIAYRAG